MDLVHNISLSAAVAILFIFCSKFQTFANQLFRAELEEYVACTYEHAYLVPNMQYLEDRWNKIRPELV